MSDNSFARYSGLLRIGLLLLSLISTCAGSLAAGASSHKAVLCDVGNYGAEGKGMSLDTAAINAAIKDCSLKGGGIVRLKAGLYKCGTIFLRDHVTLDIESGATILGSENLADYYQMPRSSEGRNTTLILAEDVHDVAIVGHGTIDGNGRAFIDQTATRWGPSYDPNLIRQGPTWVQKMNLLNEGPVPMGARPGVLFLALHVDGLRLENFHVIDSPNWTIKVGGSQNINVKHLTVRNSLLIPNNDALDVSTSRNASISDCYLEGGDDALVVGGPCLDGWCKQPTEHIKVNNVTLISRSAGIRIGPAAKTVRDLTFSRVVVRDSNRGILINARADETVEDISFTDINMSTRLIDGPWWGLGEPISMSVAHWDYGSWAKVADYGFIKNIRFSRVICKSNSGLVLYSVVPGHIKDIDFRALTLTMVPNPLNYTIGGNLDMQPTAPPFDLGVRKQDLPAILVHNADNLKFSDVRVRWFDGFPDYYTNALAADNFSGLTIKNFTGAAARKTLPAISLANGSGKDIRNARATAGVLLEEHNVR